MIPHYTLQEVADMLGIGKAAVQYHIAKGRIRTVRKLLRVYVTQDALAEFLQNRPTHKSPRNYTPDRRDEGWYSINQAADILGIHPSGVQAQIDNGRLPATRVGRMWYIAQDDLDHFIAVNRRKPGQSKRLKPIPCAYCQGPFDPIEAQQRYCSQECARDSVRAFNPRKIRIDESLLRQLYLDEGLNAIDIAARLGIAQQAVLDRLHAAGIPVRNGSSSGPRKPAPPRPPRFPVPPREELERLIVVERIGMMRAAEIYGVSEGTVARWLDSYAMPHPQEGGYGSRVQANDGHAVRSTYELTVDNWLSNHNIPHEYEPTLPFSNRFRADFYANGWYIEVWGIQYNASYDERKQRKIALYRQYSIPLIELSAKDFISDDWQRILRRCRISPD
jgi:excisionase family DNA binding protein